MGDTIDQTGLENVSKTSNDSLLARVSTPQSDEDSIKLKELIEFYTKLQPRVLDLENTKTAQAQEITSLKLREDASKQRRKIDDIDKDAEFTLVDETQRMYGDDLMFDTSDLASEEVFVVEQGVPGSKKDDVVSTAGIATTTKVVKRNYLQRASGIYNNNITFLPTTIAGSRFMDKGLKVKGSETRVEGSSKRAREELEQESSKKQKLEDDKEIVKLKRLMEVMRDKEEVALDVIPLAIKSLSIVDWKIHKEGKKSYYQIIRADGHLKMYLVFSHMLKSFNIKDLETLYKLLKAKYGSTRPAEDLDLVLYGDLKTMFEPHVEDNIWKNQSDYKVLDWKLYDSCGVHSLRKQNVYIHMLVDKRYPFTTPTITNMLNRKLKDDHWNEMWRIVGIKSLLEVTVDKMDIKSAFLYGKIKKEVYVCQPQGFEDLDFLDRVYKVEKVLYGLHQAPRACQDKYVAEILKKFRFIEVKTASTPIETQKHLLKDEDGEEVDVHLYRSMIGSLMYLTSSRHDIMFVVCACARYQVNPKVSHLHAIKRIFRYLKDQPKLGLWYPKDSLFDLVAYTDSDYAGASLDMKSTIGGCQFLGCRLIS
ncbi:ribonuclease H-like domain, reverse transcriptase, RNA-dependent DNA polymerase [Tanacetum coccineum]